MQPIHRPLNPGSSGSPTRPGAWARGLVFVALATACGHDDAPEDQGTTEAASEAQTGTTDPTTNPTTSDTGDASDTGGDASDSSDSSGTDNAGGPDPEIVKS